MGLEFTRDFSIGAGVLGAAKDVNNALFGPTFAQAVVPTVSVAYVAGSTVLKVTDAATFTYPRAGEALNVIVNRGGVTAETLGYRSRYVTGAPAAGDGYLVLTSAAANAHALGETAEEQNIYLDRVKAGPTIYSVIHNSQFPAPLGDCWVTALVGVSGADIGALLVLRHQDDVAAHKTKFYAAEVGFFSATELFCRLWVFRDSVPYILVRTITWTESAQVVPVIFRISGSPDPVLSVSVSSVVRVSYTDAGAQKITTTGAVGFGQNGSGNQSAVDDFSLSFNGTTSKVVVPSHIDFDLAGSFTVRFVCKTSQVTDAAIIGRFVPSPPSANWPGWEVGFTGATGKLRLFTSDDAHVNWNLDTGPAVVNTGKKVICHVTYDGANIKFYVAGVLNSTVAQGYPPAASTNDLYIGRDATDSTLRPFSGVQDSIVVWKGRVLSAAEVLADSFFGIGAYAPVYPADIVGLWHYNTGSGASLIDSSGKSHHGTITDGTWVSNGNVLLRTTLDRFEYGEGVP